MPACYRGHKDDGRDREDGITGRAGAALGGDVVKFRHGVGAANHGEGA